MMTYHKVYGIAKLKNTLTIHCYYYLFYVFQLLTKKDRYVETISLTMRFFIVRKNEFVFTIRKAP